MKSAFLVRCVCRISGSYGLKIKSKCSEISSSDKISIILSDSASIHGQETSFDFVIFGFAEKLHKGKRVYWVIETGNLFAIGPEFEAIWFVNPYYY